VGIFIQVTIIIWKHFGVVILGDFPVVVGDVVEEAIALLFAEGEAG